jgi:hypothetical protein
MGTRSVAVGFAIAVALSAPASLALQEFTLDEARTRIERLESRVASLEATIAVDNISEGSKTHTVTGIVVIGSYLHWELEGPGPLEIDDSCVGEAGFDDIRAGADVRALDGAGNVVGLGRLDTGVVAAPRSGRVCQFSWTMEVDDTEFYAFEIDHRGGPTYSRAELEATDWTVVLTIGD